MVAKDKLCAHVTYRNAAHLVLTLIGFLVFNPMASGQKPSSTEVNEMKGQLLETFQTDGRSVREIIDLLSESSGLNIVATPDAAEKNVTLTLRNVRVIDAIEIMAKISGLWYREEESTGTIRLMTTEEYQDDLVVL